MSEASLPELSAVEMLRGFAQRRFTPDDVLAACLDRISRWNPTINALTTIDTEGASQQAQASTRRWAKGQPLGRLDGVPIGIKDMQDVRGLPTTHGSPLFRNNLAARDQAIVARLRNSGAVVAAKTNVPEFGAGGNTRNPVWGATCNPFDTRLIVGGSSGGSAAALAADMLPLCTGSDTGGSLRLPASLCGVVGFRPSANVIAHPDRPLGWSAISVLGPMARTMDDLVLMLGCIHGSDLDDPLSAPAAADRFNNIRPTPLARLRVGVSEDFGGLPVDPEIRATFRQRIDLIAPHVASLKEVDLALGDMDRVFDILRAESFLAAFGIGVQRSSDDFPSQVRANVAVGRKMTLDDRAWAHAEQTRILRRFNRLMREVDVILLPTAPVSPFPWTQSFADTIDGQPQDIYYRWLALTYRGSLSGGPSLTLPAGRDASGMPFGLQMLGAIGGDARLLAIGKSLETLFQQDDSTARPRPDFAALKPAPVDPRSIIDSARHADADPTSARTAV
ncbi:amidase [Aquicoccus porphyridii]|uniref:Amidase n=1 Tax=Aquicoccus porphyridii TaxID=1852029 RepID=A0A5A9ZKQ1_9RHOB|nr:amidase [Aquicoccus porphyridii]KAA0917758.1 amidase [Aquicoccus porphyridii]RAI55829.1 amidase [Rhodobacteraceae bacterium AsT-22]